MSPQSGCEQDAHSEDADAKEGATHGYDVMPGKRANSGSSMSVSGTSEICSGIVGTDMVLVA